jgi:hypothetical protein
MTAVLRQKGISERHAMGVDWRKKTRGSRYRYPFAETDGENDTDSSQRVSDNSGLHDDGPGSEQAGFLAYGR